MTFFAIVQRNCFLLEPLMTGRPMSAIAAEFAGCVRKALLQMKRR